MHIVDECGDTFEVLSSGTFREVDERKPVGDVRPATSREVMEFNSRRTEAWAKIVETLPLARQMLRGAGRSNDLAIPAIAKAWRAYDPDRGSWRGLVRRTLWHDIIRPGRAKIKEQPLEEWMDIETRSEREFPNVVYILDRLPEQDRLLILLRFWSGMKLDDIADIMGVSKAGAWLQVKRAVEKARKIYDEERGGDVSE